MEKERKRDDPAQSKQFINAARAAEADETEEGADRAFNKVVGSKQRTKVRPPNRK